MSYSINAYFKHEHGDYPIVVTTPDEMDTLIDAMLAEPFKNSIAALYVNERPRTDRDHPDHELRVAIHAEAKVGSLRYAGKHDNTPGVWYAKGKTSQREEVFYYYMGHDEGYPKDAEIELDTIRTSAKEFLTNGGERPTSGHWITWPQDQI